MRYYNDSIKSVDDNLDIRYFEVQRSDNKKQSLVGDIIKMAATVDINKVNLLTFVTKNLKHLLHTFPTDVDLGLL